MHRQSRTPNMLRRAACVVSLVVIPASGAAQDAAPRPGPERPSPPHERMTVFEGTWTRAPGAWFRGQGVVTDSSAGEETCAWLAGGRRHMVCRSWREARPGAPRRDAMYLLSFRALDSTYIAHHVFPGGDMLTYHGRLDGERWVMEMQPSPYLRAGDRFRTIITREPDGMLRFVEERSQNGGAWEKTEDYRLRRVR